MFYRRTYRLDIHNLFNPLIFFLNWEPFKYDEKSLYVYLSLQLLKYMETMMLGTCFQL